MSEATVMENYVRARSMFFKWRRSLALADKTALAFAMTCLTGLLAQIRIPLPWTPVPITGQTFAVLLAGVLLGKWWGGTSQAIYVALGAAGVPWFSGWSCGPGVLFGPTGGYLLGFIPAAMFIGYFTDTCVRARTFTTLAVLMLFANFILIYIPGLLQLWIWSHIIKGAAPTLRELFSIGVIPFAAGDMIKIMAAAALASGITPEKK